MVHRGNSWQLVVLGVATAVAVAASVPVVAAAAALAVHTQITQLGRQFARKIRSRASSGE